MDDLARAGIFVAGCDVDGTNVAKIRRASHLLGVGINAALTCHRSELVLQWIKMIFFICSCLPGLLCLVFYFHDTLVVSQWPVRLLNDSVVLRSSRDVGFDFSTVYATEHRTVFDLCSLLVLLDDLTDSVVFFFVVIVGD